MLFLSCFCNAFVRVCLLNALLPPAGKGLLFVMSNCEVAILPLASWVRCGA